MLDSAPNGIPGLTVPGRHWQLTQYLKSLGPKLLFPLASNCVDVMTGYTMAPDATTSFGAGLARGDKGSLICPTSKGALGSVDAGAMSQLSVGVVFKYTSGEAPIFGCWNGNGWMLYSNGGGSVAAYVDGTSLSYTVSVADGKPHDLVMRYNPTWTWLDIALDGVVLTGKIAASSAAPTTKWGVNYYSGAARSGVISASNAFVFDRVLTLTELANIHTLRVA